MKHKVHIVLYKAIPDRHCSPGTKGYSSPIPIAFVTVPATPPVHTAGTSQAEGSVPATAVAKEAAGFVAATAAGAAESAQARVGVGARGEGGEDVLVEGIVLVGIGVVVGVEGVEVGVGDRVVRFVRVVGS